MPCRLNVLEKSTPGGTTMGAVSPNSALGGSEAAGEFFTIGLEDSKSDNSLHGTSLG